MKVQSIAVLVVLQLVVQLTFAAPAIAQPARAYDDPVTGASVIRLTNDGALGCTNYMGNQSGESTAWSIDSKRIVYAKWCENAPERTGIYVYDLAVAAESCVASTDRHWANPIFDHDGDTVWFIDGSGRPRDASGTKPFAIRSVAVPSVLAGQASCPDAASTRLDLRQASDGRVDDVRVMTKNAASDAASPSESLFGTHVFSDGRWRTIVFDSNGTLLAGWGFDDQTNPPHSDYHDGDASIWSPVDGGLIFTNRGTSATDDTVRRGVFTLEAEPVLRYQPFPFDQACSGDYQTPTTVAHSDWIWHRQSRTDVFLSSDRCVWSRDDQGATTLGPWRIFGYVHAYFDRSSVDGAITDIRFVVDEYFDSSDAEPYLYVATLGDVGVGGTGFDNWESLRASRKLVGHRMRMDDGTNGSLQAFQPHPQFSPDGRWVLWQSSSLNTVLGYSCPAATCGPAGAGVDANTSYLDLYLTSTGSEDDLGDVNCDGVINEGDVIAILDLLASRREAVGDCGLANAASDVSFAAADLNGDGVLRIDDALIVAQLLG